MTAYGRRMLARRTEVVSCGHLAKRREWIFQRPGEHGWLCESCHGRLAADAAARAIQQQQAQQWR